MSTSNNEESFPLKPRAHQSEKMRPRPNILITGTPGTGKSTLADTVCSTLGFRHYDVSRLSKEKGFTTGYDATMDTYDLDEDPLLDYLEEELKEGGCVVDYHSCDFFPERWFDLVVVLRVNTEELYDRLTRRGYSEAKRGENMECEIMCVVQEEARESYDEDIIVVLSSNSTAEMDDNSQRIAQWVAAWMQNNS
jgi:adenylate kinase